MSYLGRGPGRLIAPPNAGSLDYSQLNPATTAALAPMRNRLINGGFRIAQRGNPQGIGTNAFIYGAADRWMVYSGGAASGCANDWAAPGAIKAFRVTPNAAGVSQISIVQRIESYNIYDLAGQNATFSGYFLTQGALSGLNITCSVPSALDNWATNTVSSLGSLVASVNAWVPFALTFKVPSGATNGFGIHLDFLNPQNAQAVAVSNLQLEAGSIATPFEQRPVGFEMALCQRYYEAGLLFLQTYAEAASYARWLMVPYIIPKRATPTVALSGGSMVNITGTPSIIANYQNLFLLSANSTAAGSVVINGMNWVANAEL